VHALLFTFLWVGINWVSNKPETPEAIIWNEQDLLQAPPPEVVPPQPAPTPVVKEVETPKEAPLEDPDIVSARINKQKQRDREKAEKEEDKKQKEKADEAKRVDDEHKKQIEANKRQAEKDAKVAEQIRKDVMKGITGDANSTSTSGTSIKSQGSKLDAGWAGRINTKIKSNTNFGGVSDNNAPVEYDVRLLPDGSVAGNPRKTKSSGNPEFDDAVLRAIFASQPFPPDSSGSVPRDTITISHRPKSQ
jgi:colicin import membrane protein